MQIVGLGTEIVEVLRIRRLIDRHGERFLTRIYTAKELRACHERKRVFEHFASRWAAKEAVLRSLGMPKRKSLVWTDLEVRLEADHSPQVRLSGSVREWAESIQVSMVRLSLAHCRAYAMATALALGDPSKRPE